MRRAILRLVIAAGIVSLFTNYSYTVSPTVQSMRVTKAGRTIQSQLAFQEMNTVDLKGPFSSKMNN